MSRNFTYVEQYTPENFYTPVVQGSTAKTVLFLNPARQQGIYILAPGESLKAQLIVPPGVKNFSATIQVGDWKTSSRNGEFLYAKSLADYSDVEQYKPEHATSFPFQFINTFFADGDVPKSTVSNKVTTQQQMAYMIFENTTQDKNFILKTISLYMVVDDASLDIYNQWAESTGRHLPPRGNISGGTGFANPFKPEEPQPMTEPDTTMANGQPTGTYIRFVDTKNGDYVLWDSVAEPMSSGETMHVRMRIDYQWFDQIKGKLSAKLFENKEIRVNAQQKRDILSMAVSMGKIEYFYPYAENKEGVLEFLKNAYSGIDANITNTGMVYVISKTNFYYGYLDYYVIKPKTSVQGDFAFEKISDDRGMSEYILTYPSGVKQKMYVFGSQTINIDN